MSLTERNQITETFQSISFQIRTHIYYIGITFSKEYECLMKSNELINLRI